MKINRPGTFPGLDDEIYKNLPSSSSSYTGFGFSPFFRQRLPVSLFPLKIATITSDGPTIAFLSLLTSVVGASVVVFERASFKRAAPQPNLNTDSI